MLSAIKQDRSWNCIGCEFPAWLNEHAPVPKDRHPHCPKVQSIFPSPRRYGLAYDVRITGAGDVMYDKDKLGIEGFIQEGAPEDRSYYYSLPRVQLVGRITYTGKGGVRREIDVTGQGWVDRQWGDFLTKSWEWSSLRFSNGARVNLYNFANGYQVA